MKIGIGLPAYIPDVKGSLVLDWARKADLGPFSSLGIIDRLVYKNFDSLIALAGAAAVTQRIRLMTTVLVAPIRATAFLAKQAASLDALSGGRFTLGLGVGGREDDFHAAQAAFNKRGRRFNEQLEQMKRIWCAQPLSEGLGLIGPQPVQKGGPELLIGGYTPAAFQRAGCLGDGYISGGAADPVQIKNMFAAVTEAWKGAGRSGKPRLVSAFYVVVGSHLAGRSADYIRDYYGFLGPRAEGMAAAIPNSPAMILDKIRAFADVGVDELILWPTVPDLEQVDRLAELVGQLH